MTDEEVADYEASKLASQQQEAAMIAKAEARAAVLAKLGLTADEVAVLFG